MRFYLLIILTVISINQQIISGHHTHQLISNKLKSLPKKQQKYYAKDIGSMCEFIAKNILAQKYNSADYLIKSNISYHDLDKRRLGELDLVVFDRKSNQATELIEVKCRKDRDKARVHGHHQLNRFKSTIVEAISNNQIGITITKGTIHYEPQQFKNANLHVMMPKKCPRCSKDPWEFDITLEEVQKLQATLENNASLPISDGL